MVYKLQSFRILISGVKMNLKRWGGDDRNAQYIPLYLQLQANCLDALVFIEANC